MAASGIIVALLSVAAWRDIATRTIPNIISIAIMLVGITARLQNGWQSLAISMLVAASVFIMLLPLHARGMLGGADLKLLSALTLGLPPLGSYHLIVAVTAVGGGLAALYLAVRIVVRRFETIPAPIGRSRGCVARRVAIVEFWRIRRGAPLPYGIAIAAGAAVVVFAQAGV